MSNEMGYVVALIAILAYYVTLAWLIGRCHRYGSTENSRADTE